MFTTRHSSLLVTQELDNIKKGDSYRKKKDCYINSQKFMAAVKGQQHINLSSVAIWKNTLSHKEHILKHSERMCRKDA